MVLINKAHNTIAILKQERSHLYDWYKYDDVRDAVSELKDYLEEYRYDLVCSDEDGDPQIMWEDLHDKIKEIFGNFESSPNKDYTKK